jgi:hypothetical protein
LEPVFLSQDFIPSSPDVPIVVALLSDCDVRMPQRTLYDDVLNTRTMKFCRDSTAKPVPAGACRSAERSGQREATGKTARRRGRLSDCLSTIAGSLLGADH